ncbi:MULTISPECIES: magnesium transporter CorA family protein [Dethiosulfovibrio]|uniref:Transposase n=1 Tax=Dethiosulfovibrio marinus TaxID=133532 RepID=A0ABS9EM49_9BACT|nr:MULTISPECIES: hypothetical protein [Dethiosulfovibrio]MCF4113217.1 hypothetical protein [Dethiosulfovibrio russensis]MCF4142281.1 hypothetical protein [Dethiosulfovibrio marinus]
MYVDVEHVSLILGEGYVLSFQEKKGDVFGPVRERLRASRGRLRGNGSNYLAYALMDAVVDHYFLSVERTGEKSGYRTSLKTFGRDRAQPKEPLRLSEKTRKWVFGCIVDRSKIEVCRIKFGGSLFLCLTCD